VCVCVLCSTEGRVCSLAAVGSSRVICTTELPLRQLCHTDNMDLFYLPGLSVSVCLPSVFCLSLSLSVCLSVCLMSLSVSVCLLSLSVSVCLSVLCLSLSLSVCLLSLSLSVFCFSLCLSVSVCLSYHIISSFVSL